MRKSLVAGLILCSVAAAGEEKWLKISTPSFEVLTNAGARKGRDVLHRFEQIRRVLIAISPAYRHPAQPVRIFVFRNESEFAEYKDTRRKSQAGFYRAGPDRDYIAMANTGADIYRVVFHEYVHLILHHSGIQFPLWLNEGTAELFSTAETTNSEIIVGNIIPEHIQTLRREQMLGLPALMQVDEKSAAYNERDKVGIFYAESWALVHMLYMSPPYAPGLPRFLELMRAGTPPAIALDRAYRQSSDEVLRDLLDYVHGDRFGTRRQASALDGNEVQAIETGEPKPLTRSEAGLALADLLIALGKAREAERKLKKLALDKPNSSGIEEALGDTALAQHRHRDAVEHYRRAINLGSENPRIYFEEAALVREDKGDLQRVIKDLHRAIEIDPNFSQARDLLASVEFTSKPAELSPTHSVAPSSAEIPKSWQNRKGDQRIEGKLVQIDCLGKAARFHVIADERKLALYVDDPSKVVLVNAPGTSIEFGCAAMQPRDVVVEYIAKPDALLKSEGVITSIQFR